jgi:hypothetical protein
MHPIGRRSESDIDAIVDEDPRLRPNEGVPNALGEGQQRSVFESALTDLHEIHARPGRRSRRADERREPPVRVLAR